MLLSRHPYSNKALERGRRLPAAAYIQLFSHVDACHSAEQYVTSAVQVMSVTSVRHQMLFNVGDNVHR